MNTIEDRLRAAFRADAQTVQPGTLRDLADLPAARSRQTRRASLARPAGRVRVGPEPSYLGRHGHHGRLIMAAAAAAAITAVAVLAGVIAPRTVFGHRHGGAGSAALAGPRYLLATWTVPTPWLTFGGIEVRNVATEDPIARIMMPTVHGARTRLSSVAADGRNSFVVAAYLFHPCRSWLYQFHLSASGQPSALTPFTPLRTVRYQVSHLAISANGQRLGYLTQACTPGHAPSFLSLAVLDTVTRQLSRWAYPASYGKTPIGLSLSANGSLVALGNGGSQPSSVVVMPTDARPGTIAQRGRVVVRAGQQGARNQLLFAALAANGKALYFGTGHGFPRPAKLRVVSLATGRTRIVSDRAELFLAVDPPVRNLLAVVGRSGRTIHLVRIQLATGKVTRLPARQNIPLILTITW